MIASVICNIRWNGKETTHTTKQTLALTHVAFVAIFVTVIWLKLAKAGGKNTTTIVDYVRMTFVKPVL